MPGEKILVVDDNDEMRSFLNRILTAEGYVVLQAANGLQGLSLATSEDPDLIFTDFNMPEMNGFDMLRALRPKEQNISVVLMTMHGSEDVAVEAFRLGVREYLTKPFRVDEVLLVAENALREKRYYREKEQLNRELLAAESARAAVVTLSHYLNNYLTILATGLGLLDEALRERYPDKKLLQIVQRGFESAIGILAVLNVMKQAANLKVTEYGANTPMLNIDAALKQEILRLSSQNKKNFENSGSAS
jgi:CheY-like chemotaxis protein